jgi:type IX secretion system PorP/SprF family membrane protein
MRPQKTQQLLRLALMVGFAICLSQGLKAQQRLRYSQYLLNTFLTNPAVTGVEPYLDMRAGFAQQWVGFQGAPRSIYLTAHKGLFTRETSVTKEMPVITSLPAHGRGRVAPTMGVAPVIQDGVSGEPNFHMGVGGQLFSEKTGPISYTGLQGSFAAHLRLVKNLRMGIGASMELLNYRLNPDAIEMLNANDITLAQNRVSLLLPSLNAGIAFYSERFFVAAATRQLLRNRVEINPANPVVSGLEVHYYMQAGLKFKLAENVHLTPSVALRTISPAPPALDLSLQGSWKNMVYLGFSYRHQDALVFLAGFRFSPLLRFDYAYDYTTSNLTKFNSGSHSLVLSICPGFTKSGGRRYFW